MSDIYAIGWACAYFGTFVGVMGVLGSFIPTPNFTAADDAALRERAVHTTAYALSLACVLMLAEWFQR